jgi:hypothetical protein
MAECMSISPRFLPWRDFHLTRKKGTDGFPIKLTENGLLLQRPANTGLESYRSTKRIANSDKNPGWESSR